MSVYDDASKAVERNAFDEVRKLLEPLAVRDDRQAQTFLGTCLLAESASYMEGVQWLRRAADHGYGHAAHNLATALATGGPGLPPNHAEYLKYMEISYRSGFEATVSSDPLWWQSKPSDAG